MSECWPLQWKLDLAASIDALGRIPHKSLLALLAFAVFGTALWAIVQIVKHVETPLQAVTAAVLFIAVLAVAVWVFNRFNPPSDGDNM